MTTFHFVNFTIVKFIYYYTIYKLIEFFKFIFNNYIEFIKRANISKCSTNDLNPFDNCSPVNCEEKYFGNRNFFNSYENICQSVPDCGTNKNMASINF